MSAPNTDGVSGSKTPHPAPHPPLRRKLPIGHKTTQIEHETTQIGNETAQIDIHVLSAKDESIHKSGFALSDGPMFSNHRRIIYKVVPTELQQCIESMMQRRSSQHSHIPITTLRIVAHHGVPEITLHIDARHVCSAPKGVAGIRLRATGPCILTLTSTFLDVPLWESVGIRDRVWCRCDTRHAVSIDGFVRPLPNYGFRRLRPPVSGSSIRASLGTHQSIKAVRSVMSFPRSVLTLDTVAPPVRVPEPLDFTIGGDAANNEAMQVITSSVSIKHTVSSQTAPQLLMRPLPPIKTTDPYLILRSDESDSIFDDGYFLPIFEADDRCTSAASTVVASTSVSPALLPVATDSLLFLAYLSGVMHAFEHTSQSAGRGQPLAAHTQSCVCVPDPPEVDLNKYIMGVFLSTAAAASPEHERFQPSPQNTSSQDNRG